MPNLTERRYIGDAVHWEEAVSHYSRDQVTIPLGTAVLIGNLLGTVTATSKRVPWNPAAVDGSQTVTGVAIVELASTTTVDQQVPAIVREATLKLSGIQWPGGVTAPQKATAISQLDARGIAVR